MVDFVLREMMGQKILEPGSTEEQIQKIFDERYIDEREQKDIRNALKDGKTVIVAVLTLNAVITIMEVYLKNYGKCSKRAEEKSL